MQQLKKSTIKDLLSLSKSGVFFIENPKRKKIDIRVSNNIGRTLQSLIREAKDGFLGPKLLQKHILLNKVNIGVLEDVTGKVNMNLRLAYWVKVYKEKGYKFYRKRNETPVHYKIKKEFVVVSGIDFRYQVRVLLCHSKTKILVGTFDSNDKADEFINKNYKDGIDQIIYALSTGSNG